MKQILIAVGLIVFAMGFGSCTDGKGKPAPEAAPEKVSDATLSNDKKLLDELLAIHPPSGKQLPPPARDFDNWQQVKIGTASMLVPPGWKTVTDFGERPDSFIHTLGALSPKEDLYIELRVIEDSDSNYNQSYMDAAKFDYSRSKDRFAEETILGFQPMVRAGVVGKVEIMNEYGRSRNEDGSPTWRLILWEGRYEKDNSIHKAELQARFAQNRYDEFAPIVSSIIATIEIGR